MFDGFYGHDYSKSNLVMIMTVINLKVLVLMHLIVTLISIIGTMPHILGKNIVNKIYL